MMLTDAAQPLTFTPSTRSHSAGVASRPAEMKLAAVLTRKSIFSDPLQDGGHGRTQPFFVTDINLMDRAEFSRADPVGDVHGTEPR